MDIRAVIDALAEKEHQAAQSASRLLREGSPLLGEVNVDTSTTTGRLHLAQAFLWAAPDGRPLFPDPLFGTWANASDNIPLLEQLCSVPRLCVDLRPLERESDVQTAFGVSMDQLLELANRRLIFFNLLAYQSDSRKEGEERLAAHADSPVIQQVLNRMVPLTEESGPIVRIHSIRLQHVFDRLLTGGRSRAPATSAYQSLVDEITAEIEPALGYLREDLRTSGPESDVARDVAKLRKLDPVGKPEVFLSTVVQQRAYLRVVGPPAVNEALDAIDPRLHLARLAGILRGLKTAHAAQFSASLGSTYQASTGAFDAACEQILLLPGEADKLGSLPFAADQGRVNLLTERERPQLERAARQFLARAREAREGDAALPSFDGFLPESAFEAFLDLLEANRQALLLHAHALNALAVYRLNGPEDPRLADGIRRYSQVANNISEGASAITSMFARARDVLHPQRGLVPKWTADLQDVAFDAMLGLGAPARGALAVIVAGAETVAFYLARDAALQPRTRFPLTIKHDAASVRLCRALRASEKAKLQNAPRAR